MGVSCTRTVRFERNLKGVAVVDVEYAKSSSNTVAPTTGWATTAPSWEQGKFIWERTRTEYTDATVEYSTPVCITGSTGNTGTGISSIVEEYYRSLLATALMGGSWLTKYPGWAANYYIWTRSHITYTDGGESYTTPICVTGSPGQTGATRYTWMKFADSIGADGFPATCYDTATSSTKYVGFAYNKSTSTESIDPKQYTWAKIKGEDGTSFKVVGSSYGHYGSHTAFANAAAAGQVTAHYTYLVNATDGNKATSEAWHSGTSFSIEERETGEAFVDNETKDVYVCDGNIWQNIGSIQGPQGDQGPKGDKGPALRGPQSWNDCATNYTFQAGGKGEDWKDVVIYNGNYYSCAKSHSKEADNYPTSTKDNNNHYWQLGDKIELVAANILLATYALIKNLGVEALDMRDANGNILMQCKDGAVVCNTGIFQNIEVKGSSKFSGELNAVTGSFRTLNCVDSSGNVICTISLSDSGFTFGSGDMYHQGTKDGRSLRFYTSNLYCRGLFGARERSVLIVMGSYGYYFPNGIPSTATASNYTNYGVYVSFTSKTSSTNVNYYILPLYAEVSGAEGMPVDEVWFRINSSTTYTYELQMAVSQRTRLINLNNSYNNVKFYDNGDTRTLNGGETVEVTKIHNLLMLPAKANTVLGGGIICGAFRDNNW